MEFMPIGNEQLLTIVDEAAFCETRYRASDIVVPFRFEEEQFENYKHIAARIKHKDEIAAKMTKFFFEKTRNIVPNAMLDEICGANEIALENLRLLPVRFAVCGYALLPIWFAHRNGERTFCGKPLPEKLSPCQKLAKPLFTPMSPEGKYIAYDEMAKIIGDDPKAKKLIRYSKNLYSYLAGYCEEHGVVLGGAEFQFGTDKNNKIVLTGPLCTPDTAYFWPKRHSTDSCPQFWTTSLLRDFVQEVKSSGTIAEIVLEQTRGRFEEIAHTLGVIG